MSAAPPTRRSIGGEPEPPPGSELKALLWIVAVLIAALELAWWLADRMYSA